MILKRTTIIYTVALITAVFFTARMVKAQQEHTLQDAEMDETSGIAASRINPNTFYVHNDSGDSSRFFAITPAGNLEETFYFSANPKNKNDQVIDCEDIAVGIGPKKNTSYVYLGDIGDNHSSRAYITIYRFTEPEISKSKKREFLKADIINLKYPDGPHDAETLMIDPIDKEFYIVTKREDSVGVYTAPLNANPNSTVLMTRRAKIHFPGLPLFKWITAGDISADGQQILIKSYQNVFYWKRKPAEAIWQSLEREPKLLNYKVEKQGEAIGFTADGNGYYTTSEGRHAPIYYYQTPK